MAHPKKVIAEGLKDMAKPVSMERPVTPETLGSPEKYPYGLRITLDKDAMRNLNKAAGDFSVGKEVDVVGKAKVKSVRSDDDGDSVDLQITNLMISC